MKEHDRLFTELKEDSRIRKMSQYIQHGKVSTYDHCCRVADLSSRINRRLRLHADEETLLKGAMLHDYYLYDWHEKDGGTHRLHGFRHPEKAARNADRDFGIDARTEHVIQSHMWPLTLRHMPRSREAWIVCLADKYVSLLETLFER